jgi:hypothetical protein
MSNSNQLLREFRCTRNDPYQHKCPGNADLSARQGHYILARGRDQALAIMAAEFPNDRLGFTADLVRYAAGCSVCGTYNVFCTCTEVQWHAT